MKYIVIFTFCLVSLATLSSQHDVLLIKLKSGEQDSIPIISIKDLGVPADVSVISTYSKKVEEINIYPQPAQTTVTIQFSLSKSENVDIYIYNLNGVLVSEVDRIVTHEGLNKVEWDAEDSAGNKLPSGIYMCEVKLSGTKMNTLFILME